jgi:hypothetical protein
VALFYAKDYPAAKQEMAKAKEMGYPVDPRFIEAVNKEAA